MGVIIGVMIESIIVPIPSPLVLMTAGFILIEPGLALSSALFKILFIITIPAAIAATIGNYVVYGIANYGGKPLIQRFSKFLGFSWDEIRKVKRKFGSRENFSLFWLRAIPIVPLSVVSAGAGVLKMDWKKFGIYSFLGLLPRNFILAFVGWKMREVYLAIADQIENIETLVTITILGLIITVLVLNKFKVINKIQKWVLK